MNSIKAGEEYPNSEVDQRSLPNWVVKAMRNGVPAERIREDLLAEDEEDEGTDERLTAKRRRTRDPADEERMMEQ